MTRCLAPVSFAIYEEQTSESRGILDDEQLIVVGGAPLEQLSMDILLN